MSDIFLSYASSDRERARLLADALADKGWSVWWDRTIPPGKEFDQVIEEALDSAKCVVVLWSRASTASTWVKTEAAEAMRRKILVPALIDDTKIPLEFRRLQAADLSDWQGDVSHSELDQLSQSVRATIGGIGEPVPTPAPPPPRPPPIRPRHAEPVDPVSPNRIQPPERSGFKWMLGGVGITAIAAILIGVSYSEYAKRVELQERIAREDQARAEEKRLASEKADRDAEASRKADDAKLAADARASREAAAREAASRDAASREAASRDAAAREAAEREAAVRQPVAPQQSPQPLASTSRSVDLEWNDNSLRYSGTLTWTTEDALLRFTAYDGQTGRPLGNHTFEADAPGQKNAMRDLLLGNLGRSRYEISGTIAVSGDSTTPYPHSHSINLQFDTGGSVPRLIQNCSGPGACYPAR